MLKPEATLGVTAPVDLAYVKAHSVVDFTDDDVLLQSYINAAWKRLDGPSGIMGRAITTQNVTQNFGCFSKVMRLPYGPATILRTINYYDTSNTINTLTGGAIYADEEGSYLWIDLDTLPATYDRPDAVIVQYTAGSDDADDVVKQAIAIMCATWYDKREDYAPGATSSVPLQVSDMLEPFRQVGL